MLASWRDMARDMAEGFFSHMAVDLTMSVKTMLRLPCGAAVVAVAMFPLGLTDSVSDSALPFVMPLTCLGPVESEA